MNTLKQKKQSEKLARQLTSLEMAGASTDKVYEKVREITRAKYREARISDRGETRGRSWRKTKRKREK